MDTIFALSTPPGKSAVAVVRVSGPLAKEVAWHFGHTQPLTPRLATLLHLRHPATDAPIDQALGLFFPAPHSFTGEDVLELQPHGSRAVLQTLFAELGAIPGIRMAEPGEFSQRAFHNGKMDLLQAEGIADLIDAETASQHQQALEQLYGAASGFYESLRETMLHSLALMEAFIDFPDEEIPEATLRQIHASVTTCQETITRCLENAARGERIREGVRIAIIGAPNAGKSSLLNALAKRPAAIVSHVAGTTRDVVEVHLDLGGVACILADTAGLRETVDPIEREGILRARKAAEQADIVLHVVDASEPVACEETILSKHHILVLNKVDRLPTPPNVAQGIPLSITRDTGMELLLERLFALLPEVVGQGGGHYITRARHRECLVRASQALENYWQAGPLELKCEELRLSMREIGKITGRVDVEQLLDVIFRTFCIGK